jgi:hypothetical protein
MVLGAILGVSVLGSASFALGALAIFLVRRSRAGGPGPA